MFWGGKQAPTAKHLLVIAATLQQSLVPEQNIDTKQKIGHICYPEEKKDIGGFLVQFQ